MEFRKLGKVLVLDQSPDTKLTITFVHPYRKIDGKATAIPRYEHKRYPEKNMDMIRKEIYNTYKENDENLLQFCKRFGLEWSIHQYPITLCVEGLPSEHVIISDNKL